MGGSFGVGVADLDETEFCLEVDALVILDVVGGACIGWLMRLWEWHYRDIHVLELSFM